MAKAFLPLFLSIYICFFPNLIKCKIGAICITGLPLTTTLLKCIASLGIDHIMYFTGYPHKKKLTKICIELKMQA